MSESIKKKYIVIAVIVILNVYIGNCMYRPMAMLALLK